MSNVLELEQPGPARLQAEGKGVPAMPSPAVTPAPAGSPDIGGWTEEKTQRAISYTWSRLIAPALQHGLGGEESEIALHRFELDILTVLVQASLNKHIPLIGSDVDADKADRALIGVILFMLATRVLRIYMRRGTLRPVRAGTQQATEARTPPPTRTSPPERTSPLPPLQPRDDAGNNHKPQPRPPLGGIVGDGRTLAH